jgi:hypothetical protein
MRSDDDYLVGAARQQANDVGQFRSLHRLFGNVLVIATSLSKHLLESGLTLLVVASVFPKSGFDHLARNGIVPEVFGSGANAEVQQECGGRSSTKLRSRD